MCSHSPGKMVSPHKVPLHSAFSSSVQAATQRATAQKPLGHKLGSATSGRIMLQASETAQSRPGGSVSSCIAAFLFAFFVLCTTSAVMACCAGRSRHAPT